MMLTRIILVFFTLINNCLAGSDLGGVAGNVMEPISILSDFVHTACFVIGGAFLLASIIKYFEYRRSPLMTPISTVIFLLIAGILLIFLPFVAYFTDNGLPFTLLNK